MSESVLLVWSEELLTYDLGATHPMAPGRLEFTMALAHDLGVLAGRDTADRGTAPGVRRRAPARPRTGLCRRGSRCGAAPFHAGARPVRVGQRGQPDLRRDARGVGAGHRGHRGRRHGGPQRCGAARRQPRRRAAPRDAGPGLRVLHLQRRRRRHRLAAGRRRAEGGLRRSGRPPRRRCGGGLLPRPPGTDDQPARERLHGLPRHRLPRASPATARRRAPRSTSRCRRAPGTPAGCARSTPSCRLSCGPSSRRS